MRAKPLFTKAVDYNSAEYIAEHVRAEEVFRNEEEDGGEIVYTVKHKNIFARFCVTRRVEFRNVVLTQHKDKHVTSGELSGSAIVIRYV